MKRALLLVLPLFACSAAPPRPCAVAEACPTCATGQPPPDAGVLHEDNLLGERYMEVNATLEPIHMTVIGPSLEPHVRAGAGIEVAKGLTRDNRWRFIKSTIATGGAWGDQQHGQFELETNAGVRVTLTSELTLYELYLQATEGLIFGFGGLTGGRAVEPGNVAGLGIGFRVFRAFSLELTGRAIVAFDSIFTAVDGTRARVLPDVGFAVRFDLCNYIGCKYVPIQQKVEDVTCGIYADAHQICVDAQKAGARADLCKNAVKAMTIQDNGDPVLARDAVTKFLADLAANEDGTPRVVAERALAATNTCLSDWRRCGRKQECLFAQQGDKPESRRMYSPYVLELLTALGCNTDGSVLVDPKVECKYTCDVPASKPRSCGGP